MKTWTRYEAKGIDPKPRIGRMPWSQGDQATDHLQPKRTWNYAFSLPTVWLFGFQTVKSNPMQSFLAGAAPPRTFPTNGRDKRPNGGAPNAVPHKPVVSLPCGASAKPSNVQTAYGGTASSYHGALLAQDRE